MSHFVVFFKMLNVTSLHAIQALVAAWKAACKVPGATVEIPPEFKFLIKPITLQGPCMPHLVLQVA